MATCSIDITLWNEIIKSDWFKLKTEVYGIFDKTKDVFDGLPIEISEKMYVLIHQTDSKGNVWKSKNEVLESTNNAIRYG